jgi:hypothetical protein
MLKYLKRLALASLFTVYCVSVSLAEEVVDVMLVLAMDSSGSIDDERWKLQTEGYARAFEDRDVQKAIERGPNGRIAVILVHWSDIIQQHIAVPWTVISDSKSAKSFADAIRKAPRTFREGTAIANAINFSAALLSVDAPYRALRKVIDVSGDGKTNRGQPSWAARDDAVAIGIVINGLPIIATEPDVDAYYRREVMGGPGSFMIVAQGFEDFPRAIRIKILIEIS